MARKAASSRKRRSAQGSRNVKESGNVKKSERRPLVAVVMAAGEGKRMKSRLPKVLHEIAGRSLVEHVVRAGFKAGCDEVITVVGFGAGMVCTALEGRLGGAALRFVEQTERRGTADAVGRARPLLESFDGDVLILSGDVPALPASALKKLVSRHRRRKAALTVLSARFDDPTGYGRILRDEAGRIREIVEQKDASDEQRAIDEINTGIYCAQWSSLATALAAIKPDNAQGELYLTDAVRLLLGAGERVEALLYDTPHEALGINSRQQLSSVGRRMNRNLLEQHMAAGVTVIDPETTWVHADVKIGQDTILHPGVTLEGATRIGRGCVVRSGSRLTDAIVGDEVTLLEHTIVIEAKIGRETKVGPFSHLRPGTVLGPECKVGNFVETKKAVFGRGTKASHLSYLGDAKLGKAVNVGAGTITCNYDGVNKNLTELGDGVFIGSDTQLIAPVKVGKGAYVGAGTTLTKEVPAGALALSRADQRVIEGWVERKKKKKNGKKSKK